MINISTYISWHDIHVSTAWKHKLSKIWMNYSGKVMNLLYHLLVLFITLWATFNQNITQRPCHLVLESTSTILLTTLGYWPLVRLTFFCMSCSWCFPQTPVADICNVVNTGKVCLVDWSCGDGSCDKSTSFCNKRTSNHQHLLYLLISTCFSIWQLPMVWFSG